MEEELETEVGRGDGGNGFFMLGLTLVRRDYASVYNNLYHTVVIYSYYAVLL